MKNRKQIISEVHRVVIKIGSRLLVDLENNDVNYEFINRLSDSIVKLKQSGLEVVVVSSGAVGAGMALLGLKQKPAEIGKVQACASIGQVKLMQTYKLALKHYGIKIGQILTSADDFRERKRYKNLSNTIESLLEFGVIPVINENDSVAVTEIKVGDNDKLSADVTQFLGADLLIIFTDEDGLYDKNPKEHADAKLIHEVDEVTPEIKALAGDKGSGISTGGMTTKLEAIYQATQAGCSAILANGFKVSPDQIFAGEEAGTFFMRSKDQVNSRDRWISFVSTPKGRVFVDAGAEKALVKKGSSLLPVGCSGVEGRFDVGDLIEICAIDGRKIARGIVNFHKDDVQRLLGCDSQQAEDILGTKTPTELIHRNNMVLL